LYVSNPNDFATYFQMLLGSDLDVIFHKSDNLAVVSRDTLTRFPENSFQFFNQETLKKTIETFNRCFIPDHRGRKLAYAIKCNPKMEILQQLNALGVKHYDCASQGEIELVKQKFPKSTIFYNHPIRSHTDIKFALKHGVKHFTVHSRRGIEKILDQLGSDIPRKDIEVVLRVETPNPEAKVDLSSKFGCPVDDALEILIEIKALGFSSGVYCHTGSQNTSVEVYEAAIEKLADIARSAGGINILNIGGGLPIKYFPSDTFELQHYLERITNAITKYTSDIFLGIPTIIMEPGRAIAGPPCDLYIPIAEIKNEYITIFDSVRGCFSDSTIHNWRYHFEIFTSDGRTLSGSNKSFKIVGNDYQKTIGDGHIDLPFEDREEIIFGEAVFPEDIASGDFVCVKNSGAYMDSQASSVSDSPAYVYYALQPQTLERYKLTPLQSIDENFTETIHRKMDKNKE
jgi:ornithine decarboxylase